MIEGVWLVTIHYYLVIHFKIDNNWALGFFMPFLLLQMQQLYTSILNAELLMTDYELFGT
jgi:hypothetical protein